MSIYLEENLINGYLFTVVEGSIKRDLESGALEMKIVYPSPSYFVSDFQRTIFLDLDGGLSFAPGAKKDEYDSEHKPTRRDQLQYYEGYIPFDPADAEVNVSYVNAMPEEFWWVHYEKSD